MKDGYIGFRVVQRRAFHMDFAVGTRPRDGMTMGKNLKISKWMLDSIKIWRMIRKTVD